LAAEQFKVTILSFHDLSTSMTRDPFDNKRDDLIGSTVSVGAGLPRAEHVT
jgi:hypothetical protein